MHIRYAVLLLPVLLIPLLGTSPVACGCEPDALSIAGQMSIYVSPGDSAAPADVSESLGRGAFVGKDIRHLGRDHSVDTECVWASPSHLKCAYWNEVGILYSSGRLVHVTADANYRVTTVSVSIIRKLFGMSLG